MKLKHIRKIYDMNGHEHVIRSTMGYAVLSNLWDDLKKQINNIDIQKICHEINSPVFVTVKQRTTNHITNKIKFE